MSWSGAALSFRWYCWWQNLVTSGESPLTAVTMTRIHVHGQAIPFFILAFSICYNIFMMSRSEVYQTKAKGSLKEMLNIVFQRIEAESETVQPLPMSVSDQMRLSPAKISNVAAFVNTFLHEASIITTIIQDSMCKCSYWVANAITMVLAILWELVIDLSLITDCASL